MTIEELALLLSTAPDLEQAETRDAIRHCHVRLKWNGSQWVCDPLPASSTYYVERKVD